MAHKFTNFTGYLFIPVTAPTCFVDACFDFNQDSIAVDQSAGDSLLPGDVQINTCSLAAMTILAKSLNDVTHLVTLSASVHGGQRLYSDAAGTCMVWANDELIQADGAMEGINTLLPLALEPYLATFSDADPLEGGETYRLNRGYNCDCAFNTDTNTITFTAGPGRGKGVSQPPTGWTAPPNAGITSINGIEPTDGNIQLAGAGSVQVTLTTGA